MKKYIITLIILFFVVLVHAADKNDLWVDAEGEAYQGEIETPKEVIGRAKKDAEQKAVENAVGAFVKAHTLVSNSQLAEDLIYTAVRGKIEKVKIIKEGWDEKDRNLYRVKLKALIEPVYPEKGEGIFLKLFLSKTDLKENDEVKISYESNSDCYIYIFSVAADGSVTLLLPNSLTRDNFIKNGKAYEFPPSDGHVVLKAQFLPDYIKDIAEERIKIIATKKKEEIVPLGFQEGMFKVYDAKSTGMISDLTKKLNQLEPTEWAEATAVYRIRR